MNKYLGLHSPLPEQTRLCSGSASDTYIRRELAPYKRYNVCTRLGFSCWFGLLPVSCKRAYIARNYAIQL